MVSTDPAARHAGSPLIEGDGTPESQWRPWLDRQQWPLLDLDGLLAPGRPLVVVAAHPDDEVLGVGGLLAIAAARYGSGPVVVWATDGEASHPGSSAISPEELRDRRPAESAAALERLGVRHRTLRVGLPDGGVEAEEATLAEAIASVVAPGAVVLTPWRGDGHPDHDACGRAAATAADRAGAALVEYPVWAWHWATPGDNRLPWSRVRRVPLATDVLAAKAAAVEAFATQVRDLGPEPADAAVLTTGMLARYARAEELVLVAEEAS